MLTLNLPADLAARLLYQAREQGLTAEQYALMLLDRALLEEEGQPTTGAELVAYWRRHGLIGYRPDIEDGAKHARTIREEAEAQRREGR